MYRFKIAITLLMLMLLSVVVSAASDPTSFMSQMNQMQPFFPEKYEKQLSEMYRLEDRVVFFFREMITAEYNQSCKQETQLNGYLKKALNRYWLLESNELKKTVLVDPEYYSHRLEKYVRKLPNTYDQAAFSFLFSSIKNQIAEMAPFAESADKATNYLKESAHQKAYVTAITSSPDFYRRIPLFFKPLIKLDEKIDASIEKLQQKFMLEKMILAINALTSCKNDKISSALLKLKAKLCEKLVQRIISNLEVQLETGLEEDAITGIMKSADGVMLKQVLYQGRIRTFVKQFQKAETLAQFNCFIPVMNSLKQKFAILKQATSDTESKATLDRMIANFEEMQIVMTLKLRNSNTASAEFEKMVKDFDSEISNSDSAELIQSF